MDGNTEERKGTVSVFNGPNPTVRAIKDEKVEAETVAEWLEARIKDGLDPGEIGVFVRSRGQVDRAVAAVRGAGCRTKSWTTEKGGVVASTSAP